MTFFIIAMILMVVLILGGTWIAVALAVGGMFGLYMNIGSRVWDFVAVQFLNLGSMFSLLAIPLFIFMGDCLGRSGLVDRIYRGLSIFLKGIPGELLQVNIASCAIFAACSGSSVAGAATMGRVAYPEMIKRGYDKRMSLGSVTAGGTLGIMIPPSIVMIIYGAVARQSVGQLFLGGVIPGIIMAGFFMIYQALRLRYDPSLAPPQVAKFTWSERIHGILDIWIFLVLVATVLGTIYIGIATATEAAALGGVATVVLGFLLGDLTWRKVYESMHTAARVTSMVLLIIVATTLTAQCLSYYGVAYTISNWLSSVKSPLVLFLFIVVTYTIMGCFFDDTAMLVLTVPLYLPALLALGFNGVWFGIICVLMAEIALLTPPVGLNLFTVQAVTHESFDDIVGGTVPYLISDFLLLAILYKWPILATWLPGQIIGR